MRELVDLKNSPPLREPVLVVALAVRRRAGRLAGAALSHLLREWPSELVASIEPENYFDFTVRRPQIRRTEDEQTIDWPETNIHLARPPAANRDFLLLSGFEPSFYWKEYVESLAAYVTSLGARTLISLRSLPGSVPHTRPAPILISSSDPEFEVEFGVQARTSRYQGPTDIAGVLAAQVQQIGWRTVDLTVLQPHYFPRMPNASASIAIVKVLDRAFGTETNIETLRQEAEEQMKGIESAVSEDAETRLEVAELEQQYDADAANLEFLSAEQAQASNLPPGEQIVEEIERFFRRPKPEEE